MVFRRVILSAFIAGIFAGLLLSAIQNMQVTPIILEAESYETDIVGANQTHEHQVTDIGKQGGHHHTENAWSPEEGMERQTYTIISNIMAASGFAMVLISLMSFSQKNMTIRAGVLWGMAGFTTFFVSPSLGVSPEIPGALAADLIQRQLWWLMAVVGTAGGLACIAYGKSYYKLFGPILIALPHLIGAPQLAERSFSHTDTNVVALLENLQQEFMQATTIANGAYWLVLGVLSAILVKKYVRA